MASKFLVSKPLALRRFFSTTPSVMGGKIHPPHPEAGWKMWRNLSIFVVVPVIVLAHINAFMPAADGHAQPERPEFVAYEYLRIRTKKFPWGDGNHSFFHNPHTNALPDGYETDEH